MLKEWLHWCRLVGGRMQAGGGQLGGGGVIGKASTDTRSGPRIFVGKLNKETTENDVKVSMLLLHALHLHSAKRSTF